MTHARGREGAVGIKIIGQPQISVGRQFDHHSQLCSFVSVMYNNLLNYHRLQEILLTPLKITSEMK